MGLFTQSLTLTRKGNIVRKLNDKIKYSYAEDGSYAILYAVKRSSGKYEAFGTCHYVTVPFIQEHGLQAAFDKGLIKLN